ncbi:hypothetical protein X801_00184 [Opisthorchis viverrini]|uniref:Uncharacterized protein n=2 Tax=Opisthorchis viverrini TaxID=6198 RepID=A0A1S8XB28_OPIVI|nr:hypothetical protein T265_00233 [Opisthorchis viverrini]KER34051.1 hypothetical protein T265_00233 [Opisthorchis viverrini]OON23905.1 hypothetical protein X801_00184 [Opisthorchis viverrini]
MHTNLRDIGWMCHVVPLKKNKSPAFMPAISQIPILGCAPEDSNPKSEPVSNIKSTDTPFIRLAKMGGRPDLLCFKENEPNNGPPLPYCRCDWFYLEDNAKHDEDTKPPATKHVFKVPFYMTDQECKPKEQLTKPIVQSTPPVLPPRKPKKCGKLPPHRPGYADYNRKPSKIGIAYSPPVRKEPIRFPKRNVEECNPTTLPKVLANAYKSDYDEYRKQWQEVKNYYKDKDSCALKFEPPRPSKRSLGPKGNDVAY